MIRLIFVDDEEFICRQFEEIFTWLDPDISLVSSFRNVKDTIEYISNNHIDVIVTDISLHNENGLQIAKYVYENDLPIFVIILSAYKSFEYAQEGYKYNVFSYLTKPFNIDDLKEVFSKLKRKINSVTKPANPGYKLFADLFYSFLQSNVLSVMYNDFWGCFLHIGYNFHISNNHSVDNISSYFNNMFELRNSNVYFRLLKCDDSSALVIAFSKNDINKNEFSDLLDKTCTQLETDCLNINQLKLKIIKTDIYSNIIEMFESSIKNDAKTCDYFISGIIGHLQTKEAAEIANIISDLIGIINSKETLYMLLTQLTKVFELPSPANYLEYNSESIKKAIMVNIKAYLAGQKNKDVIKYACDYIKMNYAENISQTDIANKLNMNPAYFSRYFKQKKGVNFSEYLTNIRMQNACEFLEKTNSSIEDISYKTGYNNVSLFYRTFKVRFNCTPAEYREKRRSLI